MSGYSRDKDEYGSGGGGGYSSNDYHSGRGESGGRSNYDSNGGQKRNYSDNNSRSGGGSYNRGRNDHRDNNDDSASGGYNRGRNDQHNNSSDDNRMETQPDTIFIQNLPRNVTNDELKDVFSQIGVIKIDKKTGTSKIWIYKDKVTGEGKGEATITYEDEEAAQAAINWYNDKEVLSSIVKISIATRRASAFGGRGRGRGGFRGRGGGGGGGGDFGGYRGRDHRGGGGGGGEYRGSGRGASHGSSRDNRSNPY